MIKTRDQIMRERQTDVNFLQFNLLVREPLDATLAASKRQQSAWLKEQGISYEPAAPDGWFEGDPGCYAVYFNGGEDERLAAYSAAFEDKTGGSLNPEIYQMYVMPFDYWLRESQGCDSA